VPLIGSFLSRARALLFGLPRSRSNQSPDNRRQRPVFTFSHALNELPQLGRQRHRYLVAISHRHTSVSRTVLDNRDFSINAPRGHEPVIQLILPMDRAILEEYLALVEGKIADVERHIARQRELIDQLERDRHDTREATELLDQFEHLQAQHIADRDRLRQELGL
jgi:hypothetical protein